VLLEDGPRAADPLAGLSYRAAIRTLAEFGWPEAYRCAAAGWIPILAVSAATAGLTIATFIVQQMAVQIVCALLAAIGAAVAASLWTGRSWERPARARLGMLTAHDPNRASIHVAVAQDDASRACRALRCARLNVVSSRWSTAPPDDPHLNAVMMITTPLAFPELDFDALAERTREVLRGEGIHTRC